MVKMNLAHINDAKILSFKLKHGNFASFGLVMLMTYLKIGTWLQMRVPTMV